MVGGRMIQMDEGYANSFHPDLSSLSASGNRRDAH